MSNTNQTPIAVVPIDNTQIDYTKNVSKNPWYWVTFSFIILLLIAVIIIYILYTRQCITKVTVFSSSEL